VISHFLKAYTRHNFSEEKNAKNGFSNEIKQTETNLFKKFEKKNKRSTQFHWACQFVYTEFW
jgi:hypothetical protein